MRTKLTKPLRRAATVFTAALTAIVMLAAPALAHEPVILDSSDVLPWNGPLLLDGRAPVGLFGDLPNAGAVRSAQLNFVAGQQVELIYAIPNQAPETTLSTGKLPIVMLIAPDGKASVLSPNIRQVEGPAPYDLMFLNQYSAPAVTGTYSLVVTGLAPSRFVISVGPESDLVPQIARGEFATLDQVNEWYGIS